MPQDEVYDDPELLWTTKTSVCTDKRKRKMASPSRRELLPRDLPRILFTSANSMTWLSSARLSWPKLRGNGCAHLASRVLVPTDLKPLLNIHADVKTTACQVTVCHGTCSPTLLVLRKILFTKWNMSTVISSSSGCLMNFITVSRSCVHSFYICQRDVVERLDDFLTRVTPGMDLLISPT